VEIPQKTHRNKEGVVSGFLTLLDMATLPIEDYVTSFNPNNPKNYASK
jgi:hypothetical protein